MSDRTWWELTVAFALLGALLAVVAASIGGCQEPWRFALAGLVGFVSLPLGLQVVAVAFQSDGDHD